MDGVATVNKFLMELPRGRSRPKIIWGVAFFLLLGGIMCWIFGESMFLFVSCNNSKLC